MGRIINEKDIIDRNIDSYLKQTTEQYTKYFQGTPTFVTYYSLDKVNSTIDPGLENVIEIIGDESPLKFGKIENFVLYGINELSTSIQLGEFGVETEVNSTAIILPDTIEPRPNDFFVITYGEEEYLFHINEINVNNLYGKKFYEINFFLSTETIDQLESNVEEEYSLFYENIGQENELILKKSSAILADYASQLTNELIKFYINSFYSKRLNIIIYKFNDYRIYNPHLIKFIKSNKILELKRSYMTSIYLDGIFEATGEFIQLHKRTLYNAVTKGNLELFDSENFYMTQIKSEIVPFINDYRPIYKANYYAGDSIEDSELIVRPHNDELIDRIDSHTLFPDSQETKLDNILIEYFNNNIAIDSTFLDSINSIDLELSLSNYLLLPCIIFILKSFISETMK